MKRALKIKRKEKAKVGKLGLIVLALLVASLVSAAYCFIQASKKTNRNHRVLESVAELELISAQLLIDSALFNRSTLVKKLPAVDRLLDDLKAIEPNSEFQQLLSPEIQAVDSSWTNFALELGREKVALNSFDQLDIDRLGMISSLNVTLQDWLVKIDAPQSLQGYSREIGQELSFLQKDAKILFDQNTDASLQQLTAAWATIKLYLEQISTIEDVDAKVLINEMQSEIIQLDSFFEDVSKDKSQLVQSQLTSLHAKYSEMLLTLEKLQAVVKVMEHEKNYLFRLGVVAALFSLLLVFILVIVFLRETQQKIEASKRRENKNQKAIQRLLDEMTDLAEGDLTARATVTEDMTGAIADAVNYAIETITDLVVTIADTSDKVAVAAEQTDGVAKQLSQSSGVQRREIKRSSTYITAMANVMHQMAEEADRVHDTAEQSLQLAAIGKAGVSEAIDSGKEIRSQILDTSKRLKRLGESSQQIGEIIGLVNDIAERTNLLALNASIQAGASGDRQRLSPVADEVQTLAEKVNEATSEIEALVVTIQADTRKAIGSMEQSTQGVVKISSQIEQAGFELSEIQTVSQSLAEKIQGIVRKSEKQADVATKLSGNMKVISGIAEETHTAMDETISSISGLQSTAAQLTAIAEGFSLPHEIKNERHSGEIIG